MKNNDEYNDAYEDVIIENYGIQVVITNVLVRKYKNTGRKIYFNHPDSIYKIENALKAIVPGEQAEKKLEERLNWGCTIQ